MGTASNAKVNFFQLSSLTPNNFRSAGSHFSLSLKEREKNIWKEMGLNSGPLATEATALASKHGVSLQEFEQLSLRQKGFRAIIMRYLLPKRQS